MVTLQYVASPGPSDAVIKWYSHGWPTHVDVVVPAPIKLLGAAKNVLKEIPAGLLGARMNGGVQIRKPDYQAFTKVAHVTLPMGPLCEEKFWHFLADQIGKPYDEAAILAFAANRNWREDDSWICSELVERAKEVCGFYLHPLANVANRLTPTDSLNLSSVYAEVVAIR